MNNEIKCIVAETLMEGLMGGAIGIVLQRVVYPKCNTAEKVVVTLGTCVGAWTLGRAFGKKFYKWCDENVSDVDFGDIIDQV